MTKLQIISRLWVHVSDLLLIAVGQGVKTLEDVQRELDITEYACRPYADPAALMLIVMTTNFIRWTC